MHLSEMFEYVRLIDNYKMKRGDENGCYYTEVDVPGEVHGGLSRVAVVMTA